MLLFIAMDIIQLLKTLSEEPGKVNYDDVIEAIDDFYEFTPTGFSNGEKVNKAGLNSGSCKIFSFAKLHKLTEEQTLNCFGDFYRHDVLQYPRNADHDNIRRFMQTGWAGIDFDGTALTAKS